MNGDNGEHCGSQTIDSNDCAFKNPQSRSSDCVNLPKKAFGEMFEDMITNESERVVQQNFVICWLTQTVRKFVSPYIH